MGFNNEKINLKVCLYQPEIPANTGNIGRLCVGAGAELHIIKPMKFLITDKHVKRAGLDYWEKLKLYQHDSLEEFLASYPESTAYYCTTKTRRRYDSVKFKDGDILIFGPESRGIPEEILAENEDRNITIPMTEDIRSINLSNSVAVILYEAMRQLDFA
ncbi:MAG: tRNA (uridine(34)/cytosine(34)/5-carboxymethylaminomethyluridine(34)-2'-O)-methyltransferase TrmL [Candidatus Cloacimonadota bacterium]|nr:MAG: tRNA (uridine(34)/cytosine(34)/5-carboxymethylaminomethyluridine(34)-2'-O)-methyltransferase TrmL [Candidatus Cloacimonadota bacterium]